MYFKAAATKHMQCLRSSQFSIFIDFTVIHVLVFQLHLLVVSILDTCGSCITFSKSVMSDVLYQFQPKMSTYQRMLSFYGTTKRAQSILAQFYFFQKSYIRVHNILFQLCTGVYFTLYYSWFMLQKACPIYSIFCFLSKTQFHFYISKELTSFRELYMQTLS